MSHAATNTPSLNLGRAMKWMFASPNWVNNLLWVFLCVLLSSFFVGTFVLIGYQLDIVQRRSRGGQDADVDFDLDRFGDYLVRGLLPTAIYLIFALIFTAVAMVLMLASMLAFTTILGPHPDDAAALLLFLPIAAIAVFQIAAMLGVVLPLALRSGLTNDFSQGFRVKWAIDTTKFMWPHLLLFLLYLIVCGLLSSLGLVFCFVGIFVTNAWMYLVIADFGAQLYDIYLAKGGEPLPIHGESLQAEII